jgi:hypothetical protein
MTESTERLSSALADRYQILSRLGEGGMATVYLAEDLKHDRKVAVKVLRPELAAVLGADRFVQEIKTTANLQHPHILPLFDSGEADSFLYYVMPFIDGETLRAKLDRETQLGIDEAVTIASNVADALDYAHRQGVIHRDVKPENILLHDGRPMVADFGIALAVSAAAGGRMTETGLSLGTPHYMSPEQATAEKEISARSDVYSLGSVLYEMLAGEPPHMGNSAQQIIMKIVADTARPVSELRKSVPANVAAAVAKSLEKLPADRFESAAQFAEGLANPAFSTATIGVTHSIAGVESPWKRVSLALAAVTLIMVAMTVWGWLRPAPPPEVMRFGALPRGELQYSNGKSIDISADGRRIVYLGRSTPDAVHGLLVRDWGDVDGTSIPGTEGAVDPSLSPDGTSVVFATGGFGFTSVPIRVVSLSGGSPMTIGEGYPPVEWGPDGYIYFAVGSTLNFGVVRVPTDGSSPPDTVLFEQGLTPLWLDVLPSGRGMIFTIWGGLSGSNIAVLDLDTGERRTLAQGTYARYAVSGHLLIVREDGSLVALPFDEQALKATGPAIPVVEGLQVGPFGGSQVTISRTGTLIYVPGRSWGESLVWVDREGNEELVDPDWTKADFRYLALSPDGGQLAVSTAEAGAEEIWIKQIGRGPRSKLTFEGVVNFRPAWYPNGQDVLFASNRSGEMALFRKRADGSGRVDSVLALDREVAGGLISSDGAWVVLSTSRADSGSGDILGLRLDGDAAPVSLVSTTANESAPALSPDGRWLAYVSDESGIQEVYVIPFADPGGGRWIVSSNGGQEPRWAHSGEELFFKSAGQLMVADVTTDPTFGVTGERELFDIKEYQSDLTHHRYVVSPDDQRFVMIRNIRSEGADEGPVVVLNFFEELKERAGQ